MKIMSRILQFFSSDYFQDLLALITFAKNFSFLADVVSKTFAIENALHNITCIWKKLFITSPYHNNRAQKLDSRNRIQALYKFSVLT